jgi:acyl-CoA synthetase (AMP-forming)/AMP-acid ligase II
MLDQDGDNLIQLNKDNTKLPVVIKVGGAMELKTSTTLGEAFCDQASANPDREVMVCGDYRATYAQLEQQINLFAKGLHEIGVEKEDHVAITLPPGPEFVISFFGLAHLGAVIVPLDPQIREQRLRKVLDDAHPTIMISGRTLEDILEERRTEPSGNIYVINITEGNQIMIMQEVMTKGKMSSFSPQDEKLSPDDLLALLYTSGTTGTPKGTMHSHRSLISPVAATLKMRQLWGRPNIDILGQQLKALGRYRGRLLRAIGSPMTFLSTTAWHTITGLEVMLQGLLMGDRLVVMPHFHPRQALELIEQENVTILIAVPMAYQVMLRVNGFEGYDTSSLIICGVGTAPCPSQLAEEIENAFGCATYIGFGTTETGGGIAASSLADSDRQRMETVGRPLAGTEVKVVDEQGKELKPGEVGELLCRSESLMMGYYHAPEITDEVLDEEGWYHTGDLARVDHEGYINIVGRKKDLIIRGGKSIYPAEIESYLVAHDMIREAAVIGVPSEMGGEKVLALVIPEEQERITPKEILDYCREGLEVHMIPSDVQLADDFPRAESGKPQKFKLREEAVKKREEREHGIR